MGKEKGGFLSPKAIANRIKSKGLQKLRWFCQMCQKQCRDENGFKCHLTSESHQRQLLLFADNPEKYIDSFSEEFLEDFLEVLRRRCGTKRIQANIVYQEYISHKEHTHMNATKWETLTDFVKFLGREGRCIVDETEKGWYITYIDRDPDAVRKMEATQKKEKMEMDDEEKTAQFIQQQIERAKEAGKVKPEAEFTELQRENEDEKVVFNLGGAVKKTETQVAKPANALQTLAASTSEDGASSKSSKSASSSPSTGQKRKNVLDEIIQSDEHKKEKTNRKDYWLHQGIIVKVVAKKLGEKYYKKKGVVRSVEDKFGAVVKMLDSGDKIRVDQAYLETVIPAIGKSVLIVNGAYRGEEAILTKLDEKRFSCALRLSQGLLKGRMVYDVQYEDISKLHTES